MEARQPGNTKGKRADRAATGSPAGEPAAVFIGLQTYYHLKREPITPFVDTGLEDGYEWD